MLQLDCNSNPIATTAPESPEALGTTHPPSELPKRALRASWRDGGPNAGPHRATAMAAQRRSVRWSFDGFPKEAMQ